MESNWRWNVFDLGVGYPGISLVAHFHTLPTGFAEPPPLYLAGIRSGPTVFYQYLQTSNPDFPPVAVFTSGLLPTSARFPFGFNVDPD